MPACTSTSPLYPCLRQPLIAKPSPATQRKCMNSCPSLLETRNPRSSEAWEPSGSRSSGFCRRKDTGYRSVDHSPVRIHPTSVFSQTTKSRCQIIHTICWVPSGSEKSRCSRSCWGMPSVSIQARISSGMVSIFSPRAGSSGSSISAARSMPSHRFMILAPLC